MKRGEMKCSACINFDDGCCHLEPSAFKVVSPDSHWCSRGVWLMWSHRFRVFEQCYWGEWDSYMRRQLTNLN